MSSSYSFPNISFTEGIVGPAPQFKPWRNTIGVAASFRRAPSTVIEINTLQDKISYFGDDDSPGCIFLNQAISQGATNFIVSPAVPVATPSTLSIVIESSTDPTNHLAVTEAVSGTRGLSIAAEFIGEPAIDKEVGSNIEVNQVTSGTQLFPNVPNFSARGQLNFDVINYIDATEPVNLTVNSVEVVSGSSQFLALISKTAYPDVESISDIKPGYRLSGTNTNVVVMSELIDYDANSWAVAVSGTCTSSTSTVNLSLGAPSVNTYVVAVSNSNVDGFSINSTSLKSAVSSADAMYYMVLAYNAVNTYIPVRYYTNTGVVLNQQNTGVSVLIKPYRGNKMYLRTEGRWIIPYAKGKAIVGKVGSTGTPFPAGTTATEALTKLQSAILNNVVLSSLFSNVELQDLEYPVSLTLTSSLVGANANRIKIAVNRGDNNASANDFVLSSPSNAFSNTYYPMSGAYKASDYASSILWSSTGVGRPIAKIISILAGSIGNTITYSLLSESSDEFTIEVVDNDSASFLNTAYRETLTLNVNEIDKQTGLYIASMNSKLVRVYHVPTVEGIPDDGSTTAYRERPRRLAPSIASRFSGGDYDSVKDPIVRVNQGTSYIKNIALSGGSDTDLVGMPYVLDYLVDAVKRLESQDIAILACPDAAFGKPETLPIIKEIVAQCERSTIYNGLRIGVIGTTVDYPVGLLPLATNEVSSERIVLIHSSAKIATHAKQAFSSAIGLYVGYIATREPHIHPQSSGQLGPVTEVIASTSPNSPIYLDLVTKAGADVLFFDTAFGYYHFLNGRTTSKNPSKQLIAVRRQQDRLMTEIFQALLPLRSMPITDALYGRVASACDTILTASVSNGRIRSFKPTICNAQNNTQEDVIKRTVNFTIRFEPLLPADFLRGVVIRDLTITENLVLDVS